MSYDISLYIEVDTGNGPCRFEIEEIGNYTSNVSGMWTLALGHSLADFDGNTAENCIAPLEVALSRMSDSNLRSEFLAMSPSNGWGSFDGAREYLEQLWEACKRHPKAKVDVNR